MKLYIVLLLFFLLIDSNGHESTPQDKIDQVYETYRRKPINEEELSRLQSLSTREIFNQVLKANQAPSLWREARLKILGSRKEDLMMEIRGTLNEFPLTIDTLGKLTLLASLVSPDFEAEVANKVLHHASSKEFDVYFTGSADFRYHFRSNPVLLQSSLNMLLSDGRIEKDSVIHKSWEASISEFDSLQKDRAKRDSRTQRRQTIETKSDQTGHGEWIKTSYFWLITFGFLIFICASTFIFKMCKGK